MQQQLINEALKAQTYLERLKSKYVQDIKQLVEALINATAQVSTWDYKDRKELEALLAVLQKNLNGVYSGYVQELRAELIKIGKYSAAAEQKALEDITSETVAIAGNVAAYIAAAPMFDGALMDEVLKGLTAQEVERIKNEVRIGFVTGKTNSEVITALMGTKAANYQDGAIQRSRGNIEGIVRTMIQHVGETARHSVWEANQDLLEGWQFLATLDSRTTTLCASLDGKVFNIGEGRKPPLHRNCRSVSVAKLLDSRFTKGMTRASKFGQVDAKITYYEWLKKQDRAFVAEALGITRAKLLLDGGISEQQFRNMQLSKNLKPLTLEEMQKINPEAFKRAGI